MVQSDIPRFTFLFGSSLSFSFHSLWFVYGFANKMEDIVQHYRE